jgi:hypothetical protein
VGARVTWPHNSEPERVFIIDLPDQAEAVARVLGAFVPHGCRLTGLHLEPRGGPARLTLRTRGLDAQRAEHLRRRLEAMPLVRGVSLGWRAAPDVMAAG